MGTFSRRVQSARLSDTVYLQGGVSDDGKTGMLIVADYRGNRTSLEIKVDGMDGAFVTAELLDHTHNLSSAAVSFHNGVLTLQKTGLGSTAFLVKFDRR